MDGSSVAALAAAMLFATPEALEDARREVEQARMDSEDTRATAARALARSRASSEDAAERCAWDCRYWRRELDRACASFLRGYARLDEESRRRAEEARAAEERASRVREDARRAHHALLRVDEAAIGRGEALRLRLAISLLAGIVYGCPESRVADNDNE
jgi:hypothetical protein